MRPPATRIDKERFGPWAIVTGASSGIGKEFARQLAASGISVVLIARRLEALEEVGGEIAKQFGVQYRVVKADLTDGDAIETIQAATADLDVGLVISNAGAVNVGEFLTMERDALLRNVRLNVTAHLDLSHHYGQKLASRRRGGLLFVSSTAARQGLPSLVDYAATKAFVSILGEGLHHELKKFGLSVTVLLPGATDTAMLTTDLGVDLDTMPMKPMSVEQCVAEGLAALSADRATHVPGRMNRIMAAVMPHSVVRKIMVKMTMPALAAKSESRDA